MLTEAIEALQCDQQLDVSGLICPLPVLKTKATLSRMAVGEVLKVIVTHPDSRREFPVLCRLPEFELVASSEEGDRFLYWIKKVAGKTV
ncbi:sulfurtransferase TusA family protein [Sedimenticola hydrogenitrophicus]|uniref:sulfurtransferase TusA family protein n=1 Tax=Sedimenticola hydrogenitrophicus TaxID=2967975 RepID=UPI0023AF0F3A|nr:sulfurtransferase TusA family protein [Sedimenticola hydrogenitrophicus]